MSTQTSPQITDQDLERRAKMVAAIRALADFVETRTELPVPNSVHAQHSLTREHPENEDVVRAAAAAMDVDVEFYDGNASAGMDISKYPNSVDYVVYGVLPKQETEADDGKAAA